MVKRNILPRGVRIDPGHSKMLMNTLAETYIPLGSVSFKEMSLPVFDRNINIDELNVMVFDQPCNHNVIID